MVSSSSRLSSIESLVSGQLTSYSSLKLLMRGRPRYLDPSLDRGLVRFALKRGFSFSAMLPDNKYVLAETAFKDSSNLLMKSRPGWFKLNSLIRIGTTEEVGELNIIRDLVDTTSIRTKNPLVSNYVGELGSDPNFVSLIGLPCVVFYVPSGVFSRKSLYIESPNKIVPKDILYLSPIPDSLETLAPFSIKRASLISTRIGGPFEEPEYFKYEIEFDTKSSLIPFTPTEGLTVYLRAQPLYLRGENWGDGDIRLPSNVGPCLLDVFSGGLLHTNKTDISLGIKTWDAFGNQQNKPFITEQWENIKPNHMLLERPIRSDSFLFWQRLKGKFQLIKKGFFQAELDSDGEFIMSSNILVPNWPVDRQHGWVIPLLSQSKVTVSVQFEPQERQYFEIPSNTLVFIRPKLFKNVGGEPITRIVVAIKGSPNSRCEIRNWEYDGQSVLSLSYYMLGLQEVYGNDRWMAGGFCVKPLFFNIDSLIGKYSDKVSKYNAGYIYI